jgi:hypothetical protein
VTYATNYATSVDPAFTSRVFMAIRECARDIVNEDAGVADHANRLLLAKAVLRDTALWNVIFAPRLVELGSTTASTDAELKTGAAAAWPWIVIEAYWA